MHPKKPPTPHAARALCSGRRALEEEEERERERERENTNPSRPCPKDNNS
jgi:hypothetical protein